jgi:thiol-disulfide isomerase/thioredoxin
MMRQLRFALICAALFLLLSVTERKAVYAQAASSKKSESTGVSSSLKPQEINLEGLKSLLRRDPGKPRPLLINFWATWCDPCREEFPDLLKIETEYQKRGLDFAAVSLDFSEDVQTALPEFLRRMKAEITPYWMNLPDPEPAIKMVDPEWGGGLPSTFLYDAHGKLVFKHMGRIKPEELRKAIETVISDK